MMTAFTAKALRLLSAQWVTADEFGRKAGRTGPRSREWLDEMTTHGLVQVRHRPTEIDPETGNHPPGPKPREYTLIRQSQWGGL